MPPVLRVFLDGLVDYAGLFPPARLSLDPAIKNFLRYRSEPDTWMLGRFIIPVGQLGALDAYADDFAEASQGGTPVRFSVLARPPGDTAYGDLAAVYGEDIAAAQAWERKHAGAVAADRFELKLPGGFATNPPALADLFAATDAAFNTRDGEAARGFFEVDLLTGGAAERVDAAAGAAAVHNDKVGRQAVGLKFRCGGVTPDAFPSVGALADAIIGARDAGVPFKATAGLHHPVRHFADEVGATMHGFLNVFGGAALAHTHGFDRDALARVLADERAEHFRFDDGGLWWTDDWFVPAEGVAEVRDRFATSYGSCSFDEPREDLRALGILEHG